MQCIPFAAPARAPCWGFPLRERVCGYLLPCQAQAALSLLGLSWAGGEVQPSCSRGGWGNTSHVLPCAWMSSAAPLLQSQGSALRPGGRGGVFHRIFPPLKKKKNKPHLLSKSYKCLRNLCCSSSPWALPAPEHSLQQPHGARPVPRGSRGYALPGRASSRYLRHTWPR